MSVKFTPTIWKNNSLPAISAEQLNRMENGIKDCVDEINNFAAPFVFKGSVNSYSKLPSDLNEVGDVYYAVIENKNFAWNGNIWTDAYTPYIYYWDSVIDGGGMAISDTIWYYRKWDSGDIELWCNIDCVYKENDLAEGNSNFPFTGLTNLVATATIQILDYSTSNLSNDQNVKIFFGNDAVAVLVHNSGGNFSSNDIVRVGLSIKGRWK